MNTIYLLTGSNMGNRLAALEQSARLIGQQAGSIRRASAIYETAAWGVEEQATFFNQVLELETSLKPKALLIVLQSIEIAVGRQERAKWTARVIDIDILFYDREIIDTPTLKVPHPYLHLRRFTLVPLAELIPDFVHPLIQLSVQELLDNCEDPLEVKRLVVKT